MTEIEEILLEKQTIFNKYVNNALEIVSDYGQENTYRDNYSGRQIYELMQNADDSHTSEKEKINISFELNGNLLIIQNTGAPFNAEGIKSLMHTNSSPKHEDTIGCMGLGFRSVLNWANAIEIFTKNFHVSFSEEDAKEALEYFKKKSKMNVNRLNNIKRTAILPIINIEENNDMTYPSKDYATCIILHCKNSVLEDIKKELKELKFEELLFLKHIENVNIKIAADHFTRDIISGKYDDEEKCIISDRGEESVWNIWSKTNSLNGITKEGESIKKYYEIIIAYNEDDDVKNYNRENGFLYNYFKTNIKMPFPFLVHCTFNLTSDRNQLLPKDSFNEQLIDILIDFIIERGIKIADPNKKCNYNPLLFLTPYNKVDSLDNEYDFSKKLKEKIKTAKVFPTINNTYISTDDEPKYCKKEFSDYINPITFDKVLKHCDDKKIEEYMSSLGIGFYDAKEFAELLNIDADEYIGNGSNVLLIKLFCDNYGPVSSFAPSLLVDSDGQRIIDPNVKIFNTTKDKYRLPDWGSMKYLNETLENTLKTYWGGITSGDLVFRLKRFGCEEYKFSTVVTELIKQCENDKEEIKDFIFWLYEIWKEKETFPSDLKGIEFKVIGRDDNIISCNNCYLGSEYDNEIGEEIIKCLDEYTFIAPPDVFKLKNENMNNVIKFFDFIGIKRFPLIQKIELDSLEKDKYLHYLFRNRDKLESTDRLFFTEKQIKQKNDYNIEVYSINNIKSILQKISFENILYWCNNDSTFMEAFLNNEENSPKVCIDFKVPYTRKRITGNTLTSYLKYIFNNEQWLPTKNKTKVSAECCTIKESKLSPVVEVINVEYENIKKILKKLSKKEIEVLLEKIGVAENIEDLPKEKIYEILLQLPEIDDGCTLGRKIYAQLNLAFDTNAVNKLIDNNYYEKFKENGRVLAEKNGELKYYSVKDVYYVGKKIFNDNIVDDYPKLTLGKRAGDEKIEKMFCVNLIQKIGKVDVKNIKNHQLNQLYKKEYQRLLPYLYAKRIGVDKNSKKELNILNNANIELIEYVEIEHNNGSTIVSKPFNLYDFLYINSTAYIRIPSEIISIEELKREIDFRQCMADVIATMLDVDAERDAFITIIGCKDTSELEKYYNRDDSTNLSLAKEAFSDSIDYESDFWNNIYLMVEEMYDLEEIKQDYGHHLTGLNYENINLIDNIPKIIDLFKELGKDVQDFNKLSSNPIDLTDYYKNKIIEFKRNYRNRYLNYAINEVYDSSKKLSDFVNKRDTFNYWSPEINNTILWEVSKKFEEDFDIFIEDIDKLEEFSEDQMNKLNNDIKSQIGSTPKAKEQKKEINYAKIAEDIFNKSEVEVTDISISRIDRKTKSAELEIAEEQEDDETKDDANRKYNPETDQTKEYDGFIAELEVYKSLKKELGERNSLQWISGNAERARIINNGDDTKGYDLSYTDENGIHYVEVKGGKSANIEFELTKNEYDFANRNKNTFEVIYAKIEGKECVGILKLGNIMLFEDGEDFFNNSHFTVEQSKFTIRAKIKSNK